MSFKKGSDKKKKIKELFIGIDSQIPPEEYRAFSSSILGCNTHENPPQKNTASKVTFFLIYAMQIMVYTTKKS